MPDERTLEAAELPRLFTALQARGYQVVGPTLRDGAIVYDALAGPEELPAGWTDEQDGGTYRLKKRRDAALLATSLGRIRGRSFSSRRRSGSFGRGAHRMVLR